MPQIPIKPLVVNKMDDSNDTYHNKTLLGRILESEILINVAHIPTFKQYLVVIDLRYRNSLDEEIPGL